MTNEQIDRLLSTRIPGGSEARDWFLPHETERGLDNVRDVVRRIVAKAIQMRSRESVRNELIEEYRNWNRAQGLNLGSADEHIHDERLTHAQRDWLRDFNRRWDENEDGRSTVRAPEFFAVIRLGDHTEVTGFDDEGEAEAYLAARLSQIDQTNEVYFEDVIPFRIFNSAEFAATFKGYKSMTVEDGNLAGEQTKNDILTKMRALVAFNPALAAPMAALCQVDPGGVCMLATQRYYTFDVEGEEAVFTIEMRRRIENALGFNFMEVTYPGYEGETALAFPDGLADVAKAYLDEVEHDDSPKMRGV